MVLTHLPVSHRAEQESRLYEAGEHLRRGKTGGTSAGRVLILIAFPVSPAVQHTHSAVFVGSEDHAVCWEAA